MVDDKKIEAAAEECNEKVENELEKKHIPKRTFAERYAESAISECAFKAGAKWAICEFLKDLWHPASEKPLLRSGKCLVVYNGVKYLLSMKCFLIMVKMVWAGNTSVMYPIYSQSKEVSNERA